MPYCRRASRRTLLLAGVAAVLAAAVAGAAADAPGDRSAKTDHARIAAERKTLLAGFAAEERACHDRFIVTACVDDVHLRRRQALAPLRERELQLDDNERRQRVADRKSALTAREQAAVQRGAAPASAPPTELRVRKPPAAASTAAATADRVARHQDDSAARAAAAAERVQAAGAREEAAQATRERIDQRRAERQAKGKAAAPLPALDAASAGAVRPAGGHGGPR